MVRVVVRRLYEVCAGRWAYARASGVSRAAADGRGRAFRGGPGQRADREGAAGTRALGPALARGLVCGRRRRAGLEGPGLAPDLERRAVRRARAGTREGPGRARLGGSDLDPGPDRDVD